MQRLADPPIHLTDLLPSLFCCGHTSTGKELRICTQRPLSGSRSPCLLTASCSIASHGRSTPSRCHFGNATNKHLVSRVASKCSLTFLQDTKITEPVIKHLPHKLMVSRCMLTTCLGVELVIQVCWAWLSIIISLWTEARAAPRGRRCRDVANIHCAWIVVCNVQRSLSALYETSMAIAAMGLP